MTTLMDKFNDIIASFIESGSTQECKSCSNLLPECCPLKEECPYYDEGAELVTYFRKLLSNNQM